MMCIHKDLKLTADEVLDELIKKKSIGSCMDSRKCVYTAIRYKALQ